ncbi:endonuclease/exonuclease/phosphatase family protein [Celerinatantimonas sp. YJH-8]|uniref:endonuclease/exonuclease/phosphatase family protein n=1 Tax=Celerinatantimonas sp. YJH-8 TaxID=3228714 RepID=UPI0038C270E4
MQEKVKYIWLALLFLGWSFAVSAKPDMTIGSWNLDWLDQRNSSKGPVRDADDYEQLSRLFAKTNIDVLGFQEVASQADIRQVVGTNYQIELSHRAESGDPRQWPQYTGFAIRRGIAYQRHLDLVLDVTHGHQLRNGIDITLLDGRKPYLRLLVVHLKSRCFSQKKRPTHQKSNGSCYTLYLQSLRLQKWVADREREGIPFMIVGDFNRRMAQDPNDWLLRTLSSGDSGKAIPLILATRLHQSHCLVGYRDKNQVYVKRYTAYIDHLIYDQDAQQHVRPHSFQELSPTAEMVRQIQLSDHCPIFLQYRP